VDGNELVVADAHALIGLLDSDSRYTGYAKTPFITTDFALLELYWYCTRQGINEKHALALARFEEVLQYPDSDCLKFAAQLRFKHKREDLSYADCVGWALAQQLGIPFLTGDKAFKNKEGVAFVG
jgi:predicted nucleic acid-binding protein